MTQPNAWPEPWLDLLKALVAEGHSADQIAAKINRQFKTDKSRNAIIGKVLRLGLKLKGANGRPVTITPRALLPKAPKPKPKPKPKAPTRPLICRQPKAAGPELPLGGEPYTVPLPLLPRKRHQCEWPLNEGDPYLFCAQPKFGGDTRYCKYHRLLSLPVPRRVAYLRELEAANP